MNSPKVVQDLRVAQMKAHIAMREQIVHYSYSFDEKRLGELAELFTIEDLRGFWQYAHLHNFLWHEMEAVYDACQNYWYEVSGYKTYMDVMRWKPTKQKIDWHNFTEMMRVSYKKSHAQQMRRWKEKAEKAGFFKAMKEIEFATPHPSNTKQEAE